jgi:hypothetical protein
LPAVVALRGRRSRLPPVAFGLLFLAVIFVLPFNTAAFVVGAWTALLMALATVPRHSSSE